jgi:formylglycine-generating enzyme required for sulfatase activity
VFANNITVSNTTLTGRNTSAGVNNAANFSMVQFDLTWDNSWRSATTNNWDAAWVFVKFRLGNTDYLSATGATNSGTTITVNTTNGLRVGMPVFVNSGTGAFASGTVITAISSSTTFTVSTAPTTSLSSSAAVRAERIWEHCWLNNTGHAKGSIGSNGSLQVGLQDESNAFNATTNPALGAYFYRSASGTGTFTSTGAQLRWNYGAQGIKDNDIVDIRLFAIEMAYVPTGAHNIDTAQNLSNVLLVVDGEGTNTNHNRTFVDHSSNNYNILKNDDAAQGAFSPFCGMGGSAYFPDGTSKPLETDSVIWNRLSGVNTSFTIEAWIWLVDAQNHHIIGNHTSGQSASSWFGITTTYQLRFGGFSAGYDRIFSSANAITPQRWHHVAVSKSGSTLRMFVDGKVVQTSTITAATIPNYPTYIGGRLGTDYQLKGYLSNLRVVHNTALYTTDFTPSTVPLSNISNTALLLKFENSSVNNLRRKNNFETIGNTQLSTQQSKFGSGSILFDGDGDDLEKFSNISDYAFGTGNFTIQFWVRFNNINKQQQLWDARTSANGIIPTIFINSTNKVCFLNNSTVRITSSASVAANQWYHIALCRSGTTTRLFLDGVVEGSWTDVSNYTLGVSRFGKDWTTNNEFDGYLDELVVTKYAMYAAAFTPPTSAFNAFSGAAYPISSENAITLGGTGSGNLNYRIPNVFSSNDFNVSTTQPLGASFPKGYHGFYCMKYEITQQQWLSFFNSLTSFQKSARDITSANGKNTDAISYRNNISWSGSGDATLNSGTHGNVACNWLNWPDAAAYADWSGLRPMTELEYEKACRGNNSPIIDEVASGDCTNSGLVPHPAINISNSGANNETPNNASTNFIYQNISTVAGPMRSGSLANSGSDRISSGASYFGIMEMSGNVSEQVVSMGNSTGRNFTGLHGNGALNTDGNADISSWPGYVTNAITGAVGSGLRGGCWEDIIDRLYISDRYLANSGISNRDRDVGFRGIRSLPSTAAQ